MCQPTMFIFALLALVSGANCKIISCEGFVKSDIPLDLTKIKVKLLTAQGNLKFENEINPKSGYFMVPVYNKGAYKLKVDAPDGWIFNPDIHELNIDDEEGTACSSEIIFNLGGFTIRGDVRSGESSGPPNFKLGLYDATGKQIGTTLTKDGGSYEFFAKPGKYMVSTDPESSQCIDRGKVTVELVNQPLSLPHIHISGYNFKASVLSADGSPLAGATLLLSSNTQLKFENAPINSDKPKEEKQAGGTWEYSLKTDKTGMAHFYCLPLAKYSAKAKFSTSNIVYNFEPDEKFVKIEDQTLDTQIMFQASTFSVRGIVSIGSMPISEVEVSVDGVKKSVTDKAGTFILSNMKPGKYRLSGEKENYQFSTLMKTISFDQKDLIVFRVEKIAICGAIEFDSKDKNSNQVEISVTSRKTNEVTRIPKITETNNHFCEFVSPGIYTLMPSKTDLSFSPKAYDVDVTVLPKLDVKFTQFKAQVSGRISCFEKCQDITIQLISDGEIVQESATESVFKFDDIPAGMYIVRVQGAPNFWWDEVEKNLQITDKDVQGLQFRQTGYKLEIQLSHPVELKYAPMVQSKDSVQKTIALTTGFNVVFFEKAGTYTYTISSCHEFSSNSPHGQVLTIPTNERLVLEATKSQIAFSIITKDSSANDKFSASIRDTSQNSDMIIEEHNVIKNTNHSFIVFLNRGLAGHQFLIAPQSDKYLFRPSSASYTFTGECAANVATFNAEIGKFFTGSVKPHVSDVIVKAIHKNEPGTTLQAKTDSSGQYRIGPVWSFDDFTVSLHKEGYEFVKEANNPFNFKSKKLSHLKIHFLDSESRQPLGDTLVSLSGAADYRSNNIVDSSGTIDFIGLPAGEYYLQAVLQEYRFDISSNKIVVNEGETQEINVPAVKYAYSAFGKVTTINKRPLNQVVHVEGVSEQCNNHQEEDTTSLQSPEFRLRGLQPGCVYRISLREDNGQKLPSFPPYIDVGPGDAHGLDFIVIPPESQSTTTIFGQILFEGVDIPTSYRILLAQGHETLHELVVHNPVSVFMFPNLALNNGTYSVGFDPSEARNLKLEPATASFVPDATFKYVRIVARKERRASDFDEVSHSNYFGFAFLIIATFAFLNQSKCASLYNFARLWFAQRIANTGASADGDNLRRTRKAKKI
ncbi:nodal modulator 3 [Ditylenchus destructor]|uniref:Nodal modulator 3 n=1 Tax=Ditylenchus destructor TaxID=166010 RepID=A0AAD4RDQ9_9BILA|nr:nodal modulator 3 [Ditylenchus destructor]